MDELVFSEEDCLVEMPENQADRTKPLRFGAMNGQANLSDPAWEDKLTRVTVTHIPTGLSTFEGRFAPYRNKVIALARMKIAVEAFIAEHTAKSE